MARLLMKVQVDSVSIEAENVKSFVFSRSNGKAFPAFSGGAHIGVQIPQVGVRQYSVCSDPENQNVIRIAVQREPDGRGSAWMHDGLRDGGKLVVSSPTNSFPVREDAKHHILIAGGIGITPFLSMIPEIRRREQTFELHYCVRSPERAAFRDELSGSYEGQHIRFYFDGGDPKKGCDVNSLLETQQDGVHVYCCGPRGLIEATKCATQNWVRECAHYEEFIGTSPIPDDHSSSFEIHLKRSGRTILVGPNETALDALTRAGVDIASDCRTGACGTCVQNYAGDDVHHRDVCLSDSERETMFTPCVSRASHRIIVDL